MRQQRSQTQLFIMIILIVAIILFRMIINRTGDVAIEKVKKMGEEKQQQEEVQGEADTGKDPLMNELQQRIDSANDPLEELKPRPAPAPEPEASAPRSTAPPPAPVEPSADSSSR